jgi:hypothetical protein
MTTREVLIDALNVAWWCGDPPTLRLPVALLVELLNRGTPAYLYFDASAPYQLAHERADYDALFEFPELAVRAPIGRTADGLLLRHARDRGALIVSRDRFRDHRARYRRIIDDPARVVGGFVEPEVLRVPDLGLAALPPARSGDAIDALRRLIASPAIA